MSEPSVEWTRSATSVLDGDLDLNGDMRLAFRLPSLLGA